MNQEKIKASNLSAVASAREKYSNGMKLECHRELPFSDDEFDAIHNRLKKEAMQHFFHSAPVPIPVCCEQLIQVRTFYFFK